MKNRYLKFLLPAVLLLVTSKDLSAQKSTAFQSWAATPPMGWNSYDAYYGNVTEKQFKAEVDVLQKKMLPHGYEYAIIDYCWFNPGPKSWDPDKWVTYDVDHSRGKPGNEFQPMIIDQYGRLLPAINRFPSAAAGKGFKPIGDYVHTKGMKFGIHIMRGIAREAVAQNMPILDSKYKAQDIVNKIDSCKWNDSMWGVDATKPGAQDYYNSLLKLYAAWGVDFIKVDDIASPAYHRGEIDLIRHAIDQCGRPIVLSLSPGDALMGFANHADQNTNMYRISNDVWDRWKDILHIFDMSSNWSPFIGNGSWPDADMLPIGRLCLTGYPDAKKNPEKREHNSFLTENEQKTMISLWCMARSPLMWGGSAVQSPDSSFTLLTNDEILAIQKGSINNHQLYYPHQRSDFPDYRMWTAESKDRKTKYLALFNLKAEPATIKFDLEWEFWKGKYKATELWTREVYDINTNLFESDEIPAHGVRVYKLLSKGTN